MSDNVVILHSAPIDLNSDMGHQFIIDCVRAGEGLLTDSELQKKYELSPVDWIAITKDAALGRAVRAEAERRVLSGTAAREAAAKFLVKGPSILDRIMSDEGSNPRHRIESVKELRQMAVGNDAERSRENERFVISIDLRAGGGEIERYEKTINASNGPNDLIPLEGKPDDHG